MTKRRIAIIGHALAMPRYRERWLQLANNSNYEIHVICPKKWNYTWFGKNDIFYNVNYKSKNFTIHAMATSNIEHWGRYFYFGLFKKLNSLKPDLIFLLSEPGTIVNFQVTLIKLFIKSSKLAVFSMVGLTSFYLSHRIRFFYFLNRNICDAYFVHAPQWKTPLRKTKFIKPIYTQTQIGVDTTIFYKKEDCNWDKNIENKESILIGFVGRIDYSKGADFVYNVFKRLGEKYKIRYIGDGPLANDIKNQVKNDGLTERVNFTGYIGQDDVPSHLRDLDLLILASRTTKKWVDTFPLVTVQAQCCGIPVVSTKSGAIPWQLGKTGILFAEDDLLDCQLKLESLVKSNKFYNRISRSGYERARRLFSIEKMNSNFIKYTECICNDK